VITRPLAQALPLAQRARLLGRRAEIWPLLEILPLPDPQALQAALCDLSRFSMVAFVSPNAIDACFANLPPQALPWPRQVAIAVMGEGSRQALAAHGVDERHASIFSPLDPQRTDSSTLLASLDLAALHHAPVLILRGESGREFLADALRAAGLAVQQVAAYRRQAPVFDEVRQQQLHNLLATDSDWLITSSEALRILMHGLQQMQDEAIVVRMQQQHLIVPHARIAETAQLFGFAHISLTGSGDEALLAALQSCL
jgi:uroporphyrinogen-III synthase